MNNVCLLAVTVCVIVAFTDFTQARECYLVVNNMKCPYQCCGEEGSMKCIDSCDNVDCSTDEDCGDLGCCSKGKCNVPRSDCDSSHMTFLPCSDNCPQGCCVHEYGICQTGLGCFPYSSNCSLNEACASNCCYEGKCRDTDVCEDNNEQPISETHEESSSTTTTHFDWKIPIIVIAVIIAVAVKIALLVAWAMRRSRSPVVVVQRVLVPTSDVHSSRPEDDTVPFLSQDEEQIKHLQATSQHTTTA